LINHRAQIKRNNHLKGMRLNKLTRILRSLAAIGCLTLEGLAAHASETYAGDQSGGFGGPGTVENQMQEDATVGDAVIDKPFLQRWFDWKKSLAEEKGLSFTIDYSASGLSASDSLQNDDASSGMVRFYGSWDLLGRGSADNGALIWKVEHRHGYGDPAPSGFALGDLGYVGVVSPPFSDQGTRLTNLYWRQRFADGRVSMMAGMLDSTDFVDVYLMANPWTAFTNLAFSTGSSAIALPNDATVGVALGGMISDTVYAVASVLDTNSDPTEPFDGFDSFFNDNEYFQSLELGMTTSHDKIFFDNVHLTYWHKDDQKNANVPSGWGIAFSAAKYINEKWYPFVRGGYSDEGGSLLEKSISAGLGYQSVPGRDLVGAAINWGRPNEDTFGPRLDDQITTEVFYRLQLTQQVVLTGDVQYIRDPALNPDESSLWLFTMRARISL
jgi:porin